MLRKRKALMTAAITGAALVVRAVYALVGSPRVTAATALAPTNTSPPTVTGTPREGERLVGHRGEWTGSPTDYNDFWVRCDQDGGSCANISGANNRLGYVLKSVDVGDTIRLKVQAKNADCGTLASSAPTAGIPAGTSP